MERPRVVVTGLGLVTAIGSGVETYWKACLAGISGTRLITRFDPTGLPSQLAAVVKEEEKIGGIGSGLNDGLGESRATLFGLAAARMASDASGWDSHYKGDRAGVFLGTSGERIDLKRLAAIAYGSRLGNGREIPPREFINRYCKSLDKEFVLRHFLPQYVTYRIAKEYGIMGPSCTFQTACTSSAQAIGEALRAIQRRSVDVVITGGTESIVAPIEMLLFCLLRALSQRNDEPGRASRPFDAERDGFVLGEGAGILVLENIDSAIKRGAPILAEIAGYGTSCDAYRITDEAPDGRGATLAIGRALDDAGLSPEEISYVNAHGTSTLMNDRVETHAIKTAFGKHAYKMPVSSTKSMIGHTISAAGAIELITGVLALRDQVVPPTINYDFPDPECDLDYVPNKARPTEVRAVLSNSFGFGGHNDCLVVKTFHP